MVTGSWSTGDKDMEKRKLKDIEVSKVGMGCMAFSHGYGRIPEESYSIELCSIYGHF